MLFKNLAPAAFLALVTATAFPGHADMPAVIDGEFRIQPYVLPNGQGYRHLTSIIHEEKNELVLFGGLGNGPPSPPTPMNHNVYTLNLTKPPSQQQWINRGRDVEVAEPWFTTTNGFVQLDDEYYLACDDSGTDTVYSFDANTYKFSPLSTSPLTDISAEDCCAVGVKICQGNECGDKAEKRIYIMGGQDPNAEGSLSFVRYYSITHNRWEQVASMNVERRHLGCAAVARGGEASIYAISGGDSSIGKSLRSMEVYDIAQDKWTLYDNFGVGRTRFGVRNVDDKYLLLIGGDANCTGGICPQPDQPLRRIDIIDVRKRDPRFISSDDYVLPELNSPRHSPATSLRKMKGNNQEEKYMLYVVGGRTRDSAGLGVLTTTEVLSFSKITPPK
ncbi:hypothetical protein WME90_45340 [Sorangium sp. So ce375]|uniref:hypothetical protein n=1 Tax=Sorangium sp. So ce375 TaxID=3133306 RepID=UPI003F5C318D